DRAVRGWWRPRQECYNTAKSRCCCGYPSYRAALKLKTFFEYWLTNQHPTRRRSARRIAVHQRSARLRTRQETTKNCPKRRSLRQAIVAALLREQGHNISSEFDLLGDAERVLDFDP